MRRKALAPDGTVMLVEPFANDRVEDNIYPVGRLYYAASTTFCCAHAISEGGTHVLGAQAGEARLGKVFRRPASGISAGRPGRRSISSWRRGSRRPAGGATAGRAAPMGAARPRSAYQNLNWTWSEP